MKWKDIKETLWGQNPQKDIDTWKEPDPDDLNIDNAYKTRWIWYHTILAVGLVFVDYLLWEINNKLGGLI